MSVLTVSLDKNIYEILIDSGILSSLGKRCAAVGLTGNVAVITNATVASFYGETVRRTLADAGNSVTMIEIPDGEQFKNSTTLGNVYDALIEAGLDRNSFIVALGGGVVGDLAGFAAATYLRGIPFVQVPTTLLAQVDSSVGGKTAIDHPRGKNLIGAFYQPRLVLIDLETLKTLPEREFRAGMAEVVKYGVALDLPFFEFLEQNSKSIMMMERESLEHVILHCCQLKAELVELDEKEFGLRAVLNYGHTLGHALENLAGYRELVHGEAVAIGIVLATRISMELGHCRFTDYTRIKTLLTSLGLPVAPFQADKDRLLEALAMDKKRRGETINFICNRGIGNYILEKLSPEQLLDLSGLSEQESGTPFGIDNEYAGVASWETDVPVVNAMGSEFQAFEDELDDDEIIEDIEILDINEDDLLEDEDEKNDSAAPVSVSTHNDPLVTATLAELYVQQGFIDKALGIYRVLIDAEPSDIGIIERIKALESITAASGGHEQKPAGTVLDTLEGWLDNIRRIRVCR